MRDRTSSGTASILWSEHPASLKAATENLMAARRSAWRATQGEHGTHWAAREKITLYPDFCGPGRGLIFQEKAQRPDLFVNRQIRVHGNPFGTALPKANTSSRIQSTGFHTVDVSGSG
jgi:hypothetical protein